MQKCGLLRDDLHSQFKQHFSDYFDIFEERAKLFSKSRRLLKDVKIKLIEDCDFLFTAISAEENPRMLSVDTKIRTDLNALEVGIDTLIQYQTTKQVPEKLHPSLPKDLFSNKPFLIVKTDDGFKLKCQGEDLSRNEIYEYEFKLPKE
jgi:hypothetical protein